MLNYFADLDVELPSADHFGDFHDTLMGFEYFYKIEVFHTRKGIRWLAQYSTSYWQLWPNTVGYGKASTDLDGLCKAYDAICLHLDRPTSL